MFSIDCLDVLTRNYKAIEVYPILGLYVNDITAFLNRYIVIEDSEQISICSRATDDIIDIPKNSFVDISIKEIIDKPQGNIRKKVLSFGNIEIYKKTEV